MTNRRATGAPKIHRREVLLGAIALVGGAGVTSGSGDPGEGDPFSGKLQYFDREQMLILAGVADSIIPATDTPGARAARVHHFIDGMMAKWASAESRAKYSGVLRAVDERAIRTAGRSFGDCSRDVQEMLVREVDDEAFEQVPASAAFRDLKALVIAVARRPEPVCDRRRLHDVQRKPESFAHVHGTDGARREPRGGIGKGWRHLMPGSANNVHRTPGQERRQWTDVIS